MFKPKMKITHAAPGDKPPWSPTVVNVNRMTKRQSRGQAILGLLVMVFGCIAVCYGSFWGYNFFMSKLMSGQIMQPPGAKAKPPAATAAPRPAATAAPKSAPTQTQPAPANGIFVTFTPVPTPQGQAP
jgi:hypothetical protein